jgi:hypothetical protein
VGRLACHVTRPAPALAPNQLLPVAQLLPAVLWMLIETRHPIRTVLCVLCCAVCPCAVEQVARAQAHRQRYCGGAPGAPFLHGFGWFRGHAPAGTFGRLSTFWPGEFHPFATVSTPKDSEGGERAHPPTHSAGPVPGCPGPCPLPLALTGQLAGDWTRARVREAEEAQAAANGAGAPKTFYVRLLRAPGFMATTRMWRRIVCVAVHDTAAAPTSEPLPPTQLRRSCHHYG